MSFTVSKVFLLLAFLMATATAQVSSMPQLNLSHKVTGGAINELWGEGGNDPLTLPSALLLELQRYKVTARYGVLGHESPRTPSRTTYPNLDSVFVENALVYVVPKIGPPI